MNDELLALCNIPENLIKTVSSSIDKMDKLPLDAVLLEIRDKGISKE